MAAPRNPSLAWQRMAPTLATFVLLVLAVACLYWARPVLIPVAVAILLTFMLGPAVSLLQRRGLSRTPAVLIVVTFAGILCFVPTIFVNSGQNTQSFLVAVTLGIEFL